MRTSVTGLVGSTLHTSLFGLQVFLFLQIFLFGVDASAQIVQVWDLAETDRPGQF
ncbi:MAG: hypothetical protein HOB49_23340, partial [Gemmatimonadetes bacterium]|nr:hypothetical protein [Gemmatimonadota bacterium]